MSFPNLNLPTNANELLRSLKSESEEYWQKRGAEQALNLFKEMSERVPAYKDFLKKTKC